MVLGGHFRRRGGGPREIPTDLCRLSALRGLNHWRLHYPEEVEAIVDGFLAKTPGLTPFIREYAGAARKGCAQ